MEVGFARPSVSSLVFHLYGRTVHPELLRVYSRKEVAQQAYTATGQGAAPGGVDKIGGVAQIGLGQRFQGDVPIGNDMDVGLLESEF